MKKGQEIAVKEMDREISVENAQGWTRITFHKLKCTTFDGRENGGFHTSHAQGIMVGTDPLRVYIFR